MKCLVPCPQQATWSDSACADEAATIYAEDLAYIHHRGFGGFAEGAAPGVVALLREAGIGSGRVIDLGCGSGLLARSLIEAGYEVCGIDVSRAMLALARATAPDADLICGSLRAVPLPRCRAVVSIGECIGYIPSADASAELPALLSRIADATGPGGVLVFDVVLAAGGEPMSYRAWRAGDEWAVMVDVAEDASLRRLRRDIVAFRRVGGVWRRSEETHWLELFTAGEVLDALADAGFENVRSMRCYGEHALAPQRMAFVATVAKHR